MSPKLNKITDINPHNKPITYLLIHFSFKNITDKIEENIGDNLTREIAVPYLR
jgi:hypothetical protein